jgi:hypothetical protein
MPGSVKDVIERLELQKAAIDQALSVLRGFEEGGEPEVAATKARKLSKPVKAKKKRTISEQGRRNIAEGARKRWAAKKKAASKKA